MEITTVPAFPNGAACPDSVANDLQPVRRLRESSMRRLKDSEADAFAYFQRDFSQLPWSRRQPPGIRKP